MGVTDLNCLLTPPGIQMSELLPVVSVLQNAALFNWRQEDWEDESCVSILFEEEYPVPETSPLDSLSQTYPGLAGWGASLWRGHGCIPAVLHPTGECALPCGASAAVSRTHVSGDRAGVDACHQAKDGAQSTDTDELQQIQLRCVCWLHATLSQHLTKCRFAGLIGMLLLCIFVTILTAFIALSHF